MNIDQTDHKGIADQCLLRVPFPVILTSLSFGLVRLFSYTFKYGRIPEYVPQRIGF